MRLLLIILEDTLFTYIIITIRQTTSKPVRSIRVKAVKRLCHTTKSGLVEPSC